MKYYSDRMSEYIKHLKGNYKSNPMVASTILTVLGNIVIEAEVNVDSLRESFIARIKSDASRPMLKGTDIRFDAYRAALCVIRTEIDIPVSFREDFVAQKLDESQRLQIKDTFSDKSKPILLPESHPKYEKPTLDEESALFGTDNPHHLPHPDFYPKENAILNLRHNSVSRFLKDIVGDPLDIEFPNQGLQATFSGLLTDIELLELKRVLLDSETQYKTLPIDWIDPEHKIWDGRDATNDPANVSVVTHYRNNLGILFEITPQGRPSFVLDIVPNRNLTNYDSILYRKYTGENKHDTANYVYTPENKIFLNPYFRQEIPVMIPGMGYGPGVMGDTEEFTHESAFELSPKAPALMIIRGDVSKLKAALVDPPIAAIPIPIVEIIEPTLGSEERPMVISAPKLESKTYHAGEKIKKAIEGAGTKIGGASSKLSSSIDLAAGEFGVAATKFEGAATKFERAGQQFSQAGLYFKQAADEFAKIPEAMRDALSDISVEVIANVELKYDVDLNSNDDSPVAKKATEEAIDEMIKRDPTGWIAERHATLNKLIGLFPDSHYYMRNLPEVRKVVLANDEPYDFSSLEFKTGKNESDKWPRNSVHGDLINAFSRAVIKYPKEYKTDETTLSGNTLIMKQWRKWLIGILVMIEEDRPIEDIMNLLGIETIGA